METTKSSQEPGKATGVSTTQNRPGTSAGQAGYSAGTSSAGQTSHSAGGSAVQQARDTRAESHRGTDMYSEINSRAAEVMEQTKQAVTEAYDRTSRTVQESYDRAVDYGRENPGKMTLIAFGAGIGIGLLLASNFNSRSRSNRIVSPVMTALSEIAVELFR